MPANTVTAKFRIVTPMFIGDAHQKAADGIRPPSVKGALRFWWRALNWGRFRQIHGDDSAALKTMHREEADIFGIAADGTNGGGQGVFLLTVRHTKITPIQPEFRRNSGKAYMAGMGLQNRTALPAGNEFDITLLFRPNTDATIINGVKDALRVFGIIGALGSRGRRGFGSVVCLNRNGDNLSLPTIEEIDEDCKWLKQQFAQPGTSPLSAFDSSSLLYRSNNEDFDSSDEALEQVGALMNRYRTSGTSNHPGRGAPPAGQRYVAGGSIPIADLNFFHSDHNQVYSIASTRTIAPDMSVPPQRSIFGLPHPYRFSSLDGTKVSFDYKPGREKGRRASPLLVHVASFLNEQAEIKFRVLLLLLQAQFLPVIAELSVSAGSRFIGSVPRPENYAPIGNFLADHFIEC